MQRLASTAIIDAARRPNKHHGQTGHIRPPLLFDLAMVSCDVPLLGLTDLDLSLPLQEDIGISPPFQCDLSPAVVCLVSHPRYLTPMEKMLQIKVSR